MEKLTKRSKISNKLILSIEVSRVTFAITITKDKLSKYR